MESCPECHAIYGKRKRCYFCQPAKRRTGEVRKCRQCGGEFYLKQSELKDPRRKGGLYCSRACKHIAQRGRPSWNKMPLGSKRTRSDGYIEVKVADSGGFRRDWRSEHRAVMEAHLGRELETWEHCHHRHTKYPAGSIEDKQDNRLENLELLSNSEHHGRHPQPSHMVLIICQECGKEFETWPYKLNQADETLNRKYCSLACKHKAWRKLNIVKKRWAKQRVIP